jgi:hypothetical protein
MEKTVGKLINDQRGQAMIEAIIALVLLVGILATVMFFGRLGDKTQRAHFAARALAFGVDNKQLVWSPDAEATVSQASVGGAGANSMGLVGVSNFLGWAQGTRTGAVKSFHEGKIAGATQMLDAFRANIQASYYVDHNTWQAEPVTVVKTFNIICGAIVVGNFDVPDDIFGSESKYRQDQSSKAGAWKHLLPGP